MKCKLVPGKKEDEVVIFFCGWGVDERPFLELVGSETVAFLYEYDERLSVPEFLKEFKRKFVLGWSLGVRMALEAVEQLDGVERLVVVAGTGTFSHPETGIHPRLVRLTLKALKSEGRKVLENFYDRMFSEDKDRKIFRSRLPERSTESVIKELEFAMELEPKFPKDLEGTYLLTEKDAIFPPEAQEKFWKESLFKIIRKPFGHFPFYRFGSLREIFELR